MYRYVVLVWCPDDPLADALSARLAERFQPLHAAGWSNALNSRGLAIFHAEAEHHSCHTVLLREGSGAILGTVFSKSPTGEDTPTRASPGAADSAAILATRGQHLIANYWGRYVAVARDPEGEPWILRDPTGALPCLRLETGGVQVFFSHLEAAHALGLGPFNINWRYLSEYIVYPGIQSRETALAEVSEVQPGERISVSGNTLATTLLWNPCTVAATPSTEDPRYAAEELRKLTRMCVRAWAAGHQRIVHRLSGGLDSSIVGSCLVGCGSEVTGIHYFSSGPQEDERRYARQVAQRARIELIEQECQATAVPLKSMLEVSRTAVPAIYLYATEHSRFETTFAHERGATALFAGTGGDNLFYRTNSPLALMDHLHRHGARGSLRVALDVACIEKRSLWSVLGGALRRLLHPQRDLLAEIARSSQVLSGDLIAAAETQRRSPNPWLPSVQPLPPGKLWHIQSLWPGLPFHEPYREADQIERIYPLLSQPIIEWCLRLPTYVLIDGGWDRAVARRAFAQDLPAPIIRRRGKGGITQHVKDIFDNNLPFLRELLLDGVLVQRGFLDRTRLEAALTRTGSATGHAFIEILARHLSLEVWIQRAGVG